MFDILKKCAVECSMPRVSSSSKRVEVVGEAITAAGVV